MKAKSGFIAGLCLGLWLPLSVAFGDGGMFFHQVSQVDVLQPTQKVYIRWDGVQERLLVQTKYQGPAEEMVWIVPVPAEPTVETADGAVFEALSEKTPSPDLARTSFTTSTYSVPFGIDPPLDPRTSARSASGGGGTSVVEWRREIGDYDVVLLRPDGPEDVIQWLSTNGFALPDKAAPILEDYLRQGWWMVASKIHPDALSSITQAKLAQGILNPLEMTFSSSTCVYPMRLTSMAAGPVEELIYIEGPAHYVPATLSNGPWQIETFGGLIRQVPQYHYQSDIELAIETRSGQTVTRLEPRLTKLRRVFQPWEMTEDLVFVPLDYSKWLYWESDRSRDNLLIAQAATQYGRNRDPNGVPHLMHALSSGLLDEVRPGSYDHVFSSIWALGEIAVEHQVGAEVEDMLLRCARHGNEVVRMEAYVALIKLQSEKLGPILAERLAYIPNHGPVTSSTFDTSVWGLAYEMNIVVDWIVRFGTASQKEALAQALTGPLAALGTPGKTAYLDPTHPMPSTWDWFDWVVWLAASTQDARLAAPLQDLHTRLARTKETEPAQAFVQRAQVACGATDTTEALVRQIAEDETRILAEGGGPTPEGLTSLSQYFLTPYRTTNTGSLRVQILQRHWWRYEFYPMPSQIGDALLRSALSENTLSDWYTLYLLAGIKEPQAGDRDGLQRIWDKGDSRLRDAAADVLYTWNDDPTLLALYGRADSEEVKAEIAWALTDLGIAQALSIVEERASGSWNQHWRDCNRPFLVMTSAEWSEIDKADPKLTEAIREAQAVQKYFHPRYEGLDQERLAALQRLGSNSAIHPGLRFELFLVDYATESWGQPLLKKATTELLEGYPYPATVLTLLSKVDIQQIVDVCGASGSDEFRRTFLINLLAGGDVSYFSVLEGMLREVWPQRYVETQGQSILFRAPGDLATSLDSYCRNAQLVSRVYSRSSSTSTTYRPTEPMLQALVSDGSLPAGYRAFILAYWPSAPAWISWDFVEALLQQDMPDFIREALQQRLANWRYPA